MYLYRFIPKCKCCGVVSHIKRYSTTIKNHEVISDLLGLSPRNAIYFVTREKLKYRDTELLVQSIRYCQSLGFSNDDMLTNPTLLRQHFVALEHHYLSMKEGGFTNIDAAVLGRAVHYMKREITTLKRCYLIPHETDVAESLVNHIDDKEIAAKIYKKYPDDTLWNFVHINILKSFLKCRLKATDDEIVSLFRVHKMVRNKSFKIIQENIAIAEEVGFDKDKILRNGYVLNNYPKYARTIMEDFSNIAGLDIKETLRKHPKLLMISPSSIIKIYGILKEFEVPDEAIRKNPSIFTMSPETVKTRLQIIDRNKNVKFLLKHPQLLKLVLYHKRAKKRLSFIQQLQLKCASITVIGKVFPLLIGNG
nr:unnamed protein product [Callosobruchus chinensis]